MSNIDECPSIVSIFIVCCASHMVDKVTTVINNNPLVWLCSKNFTNNWIHCSGPEALSIFLFEPFTSISDAWDTCLEINLEYPAILSSIKDSTSTVADNVFESFWSKILAVNPCGLYFLKMTSCQVSRPLMITLESQEMKSLSGSNT